MDNLVSSAVPGPNSGPGIGHNQPPEDKITGTISEAADVLGIRRNQAYEAATPATLKITGTIAEAAELLGIGRNQAYEAAHRGDIPVIKIGKRLVVKWPALLEMLGAVS